jgi:tetratricopeptide (TPR) repeat protein
MADYDRAIAIDPSKAGLAYYNRGNSWRDKGDNDKAVADYSKAISLMPSYANAYVARGNIRKTEGDYDTAIVDYDTAISINPVGAPLAYYNRGVTWRKKSEPDKAIADLSQYISMVSSDPDGYVARGNEYSDKHEYAMALADYDRALAISPTDALALSNRANAVSKQNAAKSPTAQVSTATQGPTPAPSASGDCSQAETHWKSVEEIKTWPPIRTTLHVFPIATSPHWRGPASRNSARTTATSP